MQRIALLIGVVLLLLAIPLAVTAQGPEPPVDPGPPESPVFATIEYVDQLVAAVYAYVDQQIAGLLAYVDGQIAEMLEYVGQEVARLDARIDGVGGGAGGPDFNLPEPESWLVDAGTYEDEGRTVSYLSIRSRWDPDHPESTCNWDGVAIGWTAYGMTSPVETRAIALYEGESLGHGFGYCKWTDFHQLDWLPAHGETLDVQMWFFWMGTEKMTSIPVTVNALPYCDAEADPGEGGPAPLEVHFYGSADDPDGGALSLSWDLGDGTTVGGELEPVHTYEIPDTYDVQFTVTDALGGKCYSEFSIWVQ